MKIILFFLSFIILSVMLTGCKSDGTLYLSYTLSDDKTYYSVGAKEKVIRKDSTYYYDVVIPETYKDIPVTAISDNGFYDCTWMKSIQLTDNITYIGMYAFNGCDGFSEIDIPDSVTEIGIRAFCGCDSLNSITIPAAAHLENGAIEKCKNLTTVIFSEGYETLNPCLYNNESLINIYLPESLKTIESNSFIDFTYSFNIYYSGSSESWNEIKIGSGNENLSNATIIYAK